MSEKRIQKYVKKEYDKRYQLKLNTHTDGDIIDKLSKQDSMQGYIKRLIREDIAKNGQ